MIDKSFPSVSMSSQSRLDITRGLLEDFDIYLIDAEEFFIININPDLSHVIGDEGVALIRRECERYIAEVYYP